MALSSNIPDGEEFDDSDLEEEEAADHEENNTDVPQEIMNIVKHYTTWQTMEDLDTAETKCCAVSSDSDTADLKIELGKMQELSSKLKAYNFRHACYHNSLDQEVGKSLQQIVQLLPGIQSMEAYKLLSEVNQYRIDAAVYYKQRNGGFDSDPQDVTDDAAERYLPDTTADAERNLERMLGPLVRDMEKVRAARKLCVASAEVGSKVRSYIDTLEATVRRCNIYMCTKRNRKRVKLAEPAEEVPVSAEEKFRYLCKVMKKVLGARVEDVVSDRFGSSSNCCFLRESGMGGITMEINPEDSLVKDLQRRLYHVPNSHLHVETVALVLFNYADGSKRVQSCMDQLKMVQDSYGKGVKSCVDELKTLQDQNLNLKMFQDQYLDLLKPR